VSSDNPRGEGGTGGSREVIHAKDQRQLKAESRNVRRRPSGKTRGLGETETRRSRRNEQQTAPGGIGYRFHRAGGVSSNQVTVSESYDINERNFAPGTKLC